MYIHAPNNAASIANASAHWVPVLRARDRAPVLFLRETYPVLAKRAKRDNFIQPKAVPGAIVPRGDGQRDNGKRSQAWCPRSPKLISTNAAAEGGA